MLIRKDMQGCSTVCLQLTNHHMVGFTKSEGWALSFMVHGLCLERVWKRVWWDGMSAAQLTGRPIKPSPTPDPTGSHFRWEEDSKWKGLRIVDCALATDALVLVHWCGWFTGALVQVHASQVFSPATRLTDHKNKTPLDRIIHNFVEETSSHTKL